MTDNTFNLDELNELKQAYQLIDEKLDGKEIVTTEQIRTVTIKNIGFFRSIFKRDFKWSTLAFVPITILYLVIDHKYTVTSLSVLCIYYAIELTLRYLLLRKMYTADFSVLDVRTLLEEEKKFMKANVAIAFFGYAFWIAYSLLYLNITIAIIFSAILLLMIVTRTGLFKKGLVRSLSTPVEPVQIGKGRQIFIWIFSTILLLVLIPLFVGFVKDLIDNGLDFIKLVHRIGYGLAYLTVVLQGMFLRKIRDGKATIMSKVTSIMAIASIVLTIIPAVSMCINNDSVMFTDLFPAFLSTMVLYLNTMPRKH